MIAAHFEDGTRKDDGNEDNAVRLGESDNAARGERDRPSRADVVEPDGGYHGNTR